MTAWGLLPGRGKKVELFEWGGLVKKKKKALIFDGKYLFLYS